MITKKYDIFISYRREGGYETAKHLFDLLIRDGYSVSFDIDTLRSGDFDVQLYERIDVCKDFILIVDKHAFDRTIIEKIPRKKDWVRCELSYALQKGKNIIPIFLTGDSGFPEGLPQDIIGVVTKTGPEYNRYYFDDFYRKLKNRFLHKSGASLRRIAISLCVFVCISLVVIYKYEVYNKIIDCIKVSKKDSTDRDSSIIKYGDRTVVVDTVKGLKVETESLQMYGIVESKKMMDTVTEKTTPKETIQGNKSLSKKQPTKKMDSEGEIENESGVSSSKTQNNNLRIYGIDELAKLAESGDVRAYIPLAKYYYDNALGLSSYERVHKYAVLAIKANVDVVEAKKLIDNIEKLGFYDNSNYKKPEIK